MANVQDSVQLKSLRRQRASIKGQLKRIDTYLSEGSPFEAHELQIRKEKVIALEKAFEEVQLAIELEDEVSDHDSERDHFERNYFRISSTINKLLEEFRPTQTVTNSIRSTDSPNTVLIKQDTLFPKIEIKPYDGNLIEWHSFHDTFKTLVHDDQDMPAVQKFHLLKNALRGEVASVISNLNASETNYTVAWELLQKRCSKPRQIAQSHLKALFELTEITRDTPANLRALAEQAQMHVNALSTLGQPTAQWDAILVFLIVRKLDKNTRRGWERTLENDEMPTFDQLINYINKQARGEEAETDNSNPAKRNPYQERSQRNRAIFKGHTYVATANKCVMCKGEHELYRCEQFLQVAVRERLNIVRKNRLCSNCFKANHVAKECQSGSCKKCNLRHNTLLHFNQEQRVKSGNISIPSEKQTTEVATDATALTVTCGSEVLLGTAQIKILDIDNREHDCRVLLDGGSQTNFITDELAERLRLKKQRINLSLSGLAQQTSRAQYLVRTSVKARHSPFVTQVEFTTLPSITGMLPSRQVDRSTIRLPRNIKLADPEFHKPGTIDALLGNTLFFNLLSIGRIKLNNNKIILQKTVLGWLVTGESTIQAPHLARVTVKSCHVASLDTTLNKFWEIEGLVETQHWSVEERAAEESFQKTTARNADGRYCVRLAFNEQKQLLGSSREIALKRFFALERKLLAAPELLARYTEFLREYERLGHMSQVDIRQSDEGYYLPHHAVVKEHSETTKLRVVFDASSKTSTGISLNQTLLNGPVLQDTLYRLLIRFRSHPYVLCADIEKMFRQIVVHPDDRKYQQILWRETREQTIRTYRLNTVTYGTTSAPFLAVRCLQQLADDEQIKFPLAAAKFKQDFYMDDLLTGAPTRESARKLRDEAISLARLGGFNLRQWTSNDIQLIQDLESYNHERTISLDVDETRKALGIGWNPRIDNILYTISTIDSNSRQTKRTILSQIAQLFDPLGLLGPATLNAVRHKYWPIDGKNLTRKVIHHCVRCFRATPQVAEYMMGDLPKDRVNQTRPFEITGVDYCGPFLLKEKNFRNVTKIKGYVVVFVCFVTKATHLELVTDLTTETCIAAIKRFFARRGKARTLYSDNGSNFVGARNEILQMQAFVNSKDYKETLGRYLTTEEVNWSFSPPRSPHFGGLWEAAIKSFKKHLRATVGESLFTYETFNSIIIEIEAILNSRPITPLSSDPNDYTALTPAHFLIGGSLQPLPEHDLRDVQLNRLSLWQHTQSIRQHFWSRWHREYLHELHTRRKWHLGYSPHIKEGMLVLLQEDNLPPLQWRLGRIIKLHPGEDHVVRVVTVKTTSGIYRRSVKKLAPLPIQCV